MKSALILIVFVLAGCAAPKPLSPQEAVIRTEAALPGMGKGEIFGKSRIWIERHLYSKGKIIQLADGKAGVIVAKGRIDYPPSGKLEAIEKVQYTISFTMREEIRDSGVAIAFTDLLLDIPPRYYRGSRFWHMEQYIPGYSVPIEEKSDFEAARRGLLGIADRLVEYLKQDGGE